MRGTLSVISGVLFGVGCGGETSSPTAGEAELRALLRVPDHLSLPPIPEFNVPTAEKIELGRRLFYEQRLSGNQTQSCASCHEQALGFADGKVTPTGSTGDRLVRNSQGLANAVYHSTLTWSNNGFVHLEDQLVVPITSDNPVELGVTDGIREEVLGRFESDDDYARRFRDAFPESDSGVTMNKIIFSLASFLRTMISGDSPYDRFLNGDASALTEQQIRGLRLFNGEVFECHHCHSGINFTVSYRDIRTDRGTEVFPFFNNGLYNVGGTGAYPAHDQGLYDLTFDPQDRGLFRPQGLRNVALTAPYMHDGSIATLREVIDHYAAGGRQIESGPHAGDGRLNPQKSLLVRAFTATEDDKNAVVAFLEALTDATFIHEARFSNPFE